MPRSEVDLDRAEGRAQPGGSNASRLTSPPTRTTSRSSRSTGKPSGTIAVRRRKGGDQLSLGPDDAVEIADVLEVDRADVRDHADLGPGERAELGDLAEAAHRQLEDAELGVALDAADRQRHADLGVVAALGGDRPPLGRADRGEDVLRRRLAHRPGDRDDSRRLRSRTRAGEGGERREASSGTSAAAAPRARARSRNVGPAADATKRSPGSTRRESICRPVLGRRRRARSRPGASSADLVEGEGIMRRVCSARSASRATSRSSNGSVTPATSWPCSCPLPAITTTSPGPRRSTACSIARARSSSTIELAGAPGDDLVDDRERILAARVVRRDDRDVRERRTRSAPSAGACRGRGRRRSRTRRSGARRELARGREDAARAHQACARSRRSRRRAAPRPRPRSGRARLDGPDPTRIASSSIPSRRAAATARRARSRR